MRSRCVLELLILGSAISACSEFTHEETPLLTAVSPALSAVFEGQGGTQRLAASTVDRATGNLTAARATWGSSAPAAQLAVDTAGLVTVPSTTPAGDYRVVAVINGDSAVATIRVLPRLTGWLVFSASVNGNSQVYIKDFSANANPMQLTTDLGTIAGIAADGVTHTVFFGRFITGGIDLFRVQFDGTGFTNLTNDPASSNQVPALNRVTGDIYFSRRSAGVQQIFRMRPDGTQMTQVTTGSQSKLTPAVSPDGTQLAWAESFQPGSNLEVMASAIDGSNPAQITQRAGSDANPFWLTNKRLLYGATLTAPSNFEIFQADVPAGENNANLSNAASSETLPSQACSPNAFTFLSNRAGNFNTDAYHWDFGSGLVVRYVLGTVTYSLTWAQRVC